MTDPWRFQKWAYHTKTGNSSRKAVLSMLAMMADMNTGRCEAKQETLAEGCELTDRSVRAHLRSLEEMGLVARRPQWRRDRGRRGDEFLLLAPGVVEWPDGEHIHPEGFSAPPGTNGNPPRGIETSGQEQPPLLMNSRPSERGNTPSPAPTRIEAPNFALLDGKYQRILAELRRFADSKGASLDEPKALAACADFPGRDYVGAAEKMAEWFTSGPGGNTGRSSTNATWRKWLGNESATQPQPTPNGHLSLAPVRHDRYSDKRQREIEREEAARRVLAARQREDQQP